MANCANCGTDLASGVRHCTACDTAVSSRISLSGGETESGLTDSASRLAESYITQALEAVREQDTARAMQLVDRALRANPTNQEAHNLSAQLTGTAAPTPARSTTLAPADLPPAAYYSVPGAAQTPASGMMSPADAISTCFSKYVDFSGRATRAEYWWWMLIMGGGGSVVGEFINPVVALIVSVALLLPGLAVTVRRLHDIDKSGGWMLVGLVPFVGLLVLVIFYAKRGSPGTNSYGPPA
jgi:uncharacterized membrane protein YhaH (DUF805 family)